MITKLVLQQIEEKAEALRDPDTDDVEIDDTEVAYNDGYLAALIDVLKWIKEGK